MDIQLSADWDEDDLRGEGASPDDGSTVITVRPKRQTAGGRQQARQPRYHVVLWDNDVHTFTYVERMLRELFGHEPAMCQEIAKTVDAEGRAIVLTTTREHAELKRDQVHAYGKDDHGEADGSMWCTIEPEG